MIYSYDRSSQFKRDVKRCKKQGKNMEKFKVIHETLLAGQSLPVKNKEHNLSGNWSGYKECHIAPDWLLIYKRYAKSKQIFYARMGSHAELFDM